LRLSEYVNKYFAARDVSYHYAAMVRAHVRCFIEWFGNDIPIAKLNSDLVNEWIEALLETDLSAPTVRTYSRNLCAVWRDAYMAKLNDEPPLRVKKIKLPKQVIEAYSHEEIGKLIVAARSRDGYLRNGVKRADFWEAVILASYATGLRRSDLLSVKRSQIAKDGRATVVQGKTGYPAVVRFPDEVLGIIDRMGALNDRAFPWPYRPDAMTTRFRVIVRVAGVRRGSLRWLRRSAGSYAEKQQPGAGRRLLGHRAEWVFRDHYHDLSIAPPEMVEPPALALPAIAS
jgi:integrase